MRSISELKVKEQKHRTLSECYDYSDQESAESVSSNEVFESRAESPRHYGKGGFHPVYLGEKFCNGKYTVIQKLGWGTFSTVWLVESADGFFAMKIQKSKRVTSEQALDEIAILKQIQGPHVVRLIDSFPHFGINGRHFCSTFEILGPTLLDLIQNFEMNQQTMSILLVKNITKQILQGLQFIHSRNVIHTDLKPENIMIVLNEEQQQQYVKILMEQERLPTSMKYVQNYEPPVIKKQFALIQARVKIQQSQITSQDGIFRWKGLDIDLNQINVKLVDFGNSCWTFKHFSDEIQTKEYRSPESILSAPYDTSADIWSLACIFFEMLTNNYLFKPENSSEANEDEDHLAMITETIGPCPLSLICKGERSSNYFDKEGKIKINDLGKNPISQILFEQYEFNAMDAVKVQQFLSHMLVWEPNHRANAQQLLNHPFINQ